MAFKNRQTKKDVLAQLVVDRMDKGGTKEVSSGKKCEMPG